MITQFKLDEYSNSHARQIESLGFRILTVIFKTGHVIVIVKGVLK